MILDHLFTRTLFESQTDHITQFASNAHEEWRRKFDPTGTKPRIKKNSDGTEGDINVPFADLHPDWQKENLAAAHAAHRAVKHFGRDMEKAAEYVHNEWMKRNPKADYNAAQHVPYDDLPEDEKEKDRVHVRTMMQLMGHSPEQGVAEGSSYNIDQDDHDEFTPDEIVRIKNSHFPNTLRDNLRAAKKEARRAKHFSSSSDGGDSKLGSPVGSASDNTYEGVAEGILGSDPNRGQKVPGWAKGGIIGKIGRKLDPAWSDIQMTVPQHLLSKQSSVPDKKSLATKDMPKAKATSITPTRAIPKRAGINPSHPVTKNVVKTIADKSGVAEGSDRVDSLVIDALKIMRGPEMSDAVLALKRVLGDRAYNERRGFYSFYVDKIHHMYGQRGMAENNHWHAAGVADAQRDVKRDPNRKVKTLNPRTRLKTMQDKQARHPEEVEQYSQGYRSVKQGVAESNTLMKKLHQALLQEGRVKELADDLKTLNDAEFMKKYGKAKAAIRRDMKKVDEGQLNELSTNKLAQYKTAAAADAKKADQAGDVKRGDKRFGGIVNATKKQFDNDAKKIEESRQARQALMAQIVNSR